MISALFFRLPGLVEGAFRGGQGSAGGAPGGGAGTRRGGAGAGRSGAAYARTGPARPRGAGAGDCGGERGAGRGSPTGGGVPRRAAGDRESSAGERGKSRGAPGGWGASRAGAPGGRGAPPGPRGAGDRHAGVRPAPARGRESAGEAPGEAPGEARPTAGPGAPPRSGTRDRRPGRSRAPRGTSPRTLSAPAPIGTRGLSGRRRRGGVPPGAGDGVAAGPVRNPESRERRAPRTSGRFADRGAGGGRAGRAGPGGSGAERGSRRVRCGGGDRSPRSVPGRPGGGGTLDLPAGAGVAAEAAVLAPALRQPGGSRRRLRGVPAGQVGARGTGVSGGPARAGVARRRGGRSLPGRRPRPATGGRWSGSRRVRLGSEPAGARRRGGRGTGSTGCRGRVAEGRRPQTRGRRARR